MLYGCGYLQGFLCGVPACIWCGSPPACGVQTIRFVGTEDLLEALLEIVGEEAVEERVGAGVEVGEDDDDEVDGLVGGWDDVNQVDRVGDEEGQPADHKHQHHHHHHARDLSLRPPPLRQACAHACRPHLKDGVR